MNFRLAIFHAHYGFSHSIFRIRKKDLQRFHSRGSTPACPRDQMD